MTKRKIVNRTWAPKGVTLDPREAIPMSCADMAVLLSGAPSDAPGDWLVCVPRIPLDVAEARAMMQTWTMPNAPGDGEGIRTYAGYTADELLSVKVGQG